MFRGEVMFVFEDGMTMHEAKKWYEYLGAVKVVEKAKGRSARELLVFDILREDLKKFTGNFNHAYGFTRLTRYKPNKRNFYR